tara:strand:+ start:6427 stop:10095 length:3669 start_codon:yes stop_codon:yes gene_type:complete
MGNIIGEPISPIIGEQIKLRQLLHGAGYNESSISRSPKVLNLLNNKNSWIKFASGVALEDTDRLKALSEIESNNYFTENDINSLKGKNLAQNYILFNTIQSLTKGAEFKTEGKGKESVTTQIRSATYESRSGVRSTNSWNGSNDKMYGGMGGNSRGLQPIPGITSIQVESVNRGSIRKATVNLKAYNKFQFGIIEILYLKLGYLMMLEWGWDKYIDSIDENNNPIVKNVESTIIENSWFKDINYSQLEMLQLINGFVDRYRGNYQGFFGKVNNFSWSLNADNTYDITVNLITVGSVIESLSVVVPSAPISAQNLKLRKEKLQKIYQIKVDKDSNNTEGTETNSVITNLGSDRLSSFIAQQIETFFIQKLQNNKNYYFFPNLVGAYDANNAKADATVNRNKIPPSSKYYIRFGELLKVIENNIILRIVNGSSANKVNEPNITFIKSTNNTRVNYEPNLIPLDPSICIFKPVYTEELGITDTINLPTFAGLKDYVVEKDNVYYGKLMNIYLNLDYVSKTLSSNKNDRNELDLYNFMDKLLAGVNKCMGNITELNVSIKNDREVYIMDENPITGYDIVYPPKNPEVTFNIIGYTPNNGSSFVTDFNFQTKITPKLMTQISIGATAAGSENNALDAVGYKNWNQGLKNRFEEKYINGPLAKYIPPTQDEVATVEEKYYDDLYKKFTEDSSWRLVPPSYSWTYKTYTKSYGTDFTSFWNSRATNMGDDSLRDQVIESIKSIDDIVASKGIEVAEDGEKMNDYPSYLLDAFGGTGTKFIETKVTRTEREAIQKQRRKEKRAGNYTGSIIGGEGYNTKFVPQAVGTANALYWYGSDNSEFVERGYNTFKNYKTSIDQYQFDTENITSGNTGFIPVTLGLTFDGIGGIKIYNKILVNQRSLPASYTSALKFIIDGVNHTVESNRWETNISTISQPITSKPVRRKISKAKEIFVASTANLAPKNTDVSKYTEAQKKTMTSGYSLVAKNGSRNGLIYAPEETPKIQFVVHHTAGLGGAKAIIENSWVDRTDRVSTHFIIDRAGKVEQLFPLKYWGNHIGSSRKGNEYLQKSTISVELVALGYVKVKGRKKSNSFFNQNSTFQQGKKTYTYEKLQQGQPDLPVAEPYKINSSGKIVKAGSYKKYGLYHSYTKKQLAALEKVMKGVKVLYPNISMGSRYSGANGFYEQFPDRKSTASTAFKFNQGTFTHNSYRTDKSDVFPQKELIELFQKFNK